MKKLSRDSLYSLEQYSEIRSDFRKQVMQHKKDRCLQLGEHIILHFEDQLTMKYQVQEMLRIEKIFESAGIEEELSAYNPLIPDGSNWKATMMIEYEDVNERKDALSKLIGVENKVWVKVDSLGSSLDSLLGKVWAIADEDMERASEEKTSSVHFLRFELTEEMVKDVKGGAAISVGIDHPACHLQVESIPENIRCSLSDDLIKRPLN